LKTILFRYPCLLILVFIFFSCDEKAEVDETAGPRANDPLMTARNIDVLLSDSGHISARLTSGLLYRYGGDNPYLEFPKGFKIYLFDSAQNITSTIEGNRGIRREYARIMEAWGSVVVRNEVKKEQLNTEHLIWDENQHRIWSDVRVRITTPDKILFGDAMESNEAFSRYSIKNPTGLMMVKKDSI
jgi:LPS export ABC transporter protein LptC